MGKFVIDKNANGEFRFDFLDSHEQLIFGKSGYKNKAMCMNVIESIRRNATDDSKFFRKRTASNECYFNLKSVNGQIIGISKIFKDKTSREESIQLVKNTASDALVEDYSNKSIKLSLETMA